MRGVVARGKGLRGRGATKASGEAARGRGSTVRGAARGRGATVRGGPKASGEAATGGGGGDGTARSSAEPEPEPEPSSTSRSPEPEPSSSDPEPEPDPASVSWRVTAFAVAKTEVASSRGSAVSSTLVESVAESERNAAHSMTATGAVAAIRTCSLPPEPKSGKICKENLVIILPTLKQHLQP